MALPYFIKVDQIFEDKGYIRPDLRENYELLINYYKSKNNPKSQLHYIGKLLKADSILHTKFKYLSGRIHKEYDTKELVIEKKKIENLLDKRKYNDFIFTGVIALLFLSLLFIAYRHLRNKNIYRQKFEELMKKSEVKVEAKNITNGIEEINQDTVAAVLKP